MDANHPLAADYCDGRAASITNIILNFLLLIFIPVSYVPQYLSIMNRASSFGVSRSSAFLGAIATTGHVAIILTSYLSDPALFCCSLHSGSAFRCSFANLGVLQLVVFWIAQTILFFLVELYPADGIERSHIPPAFYTLIMAALLAPSIHYSRKPYGEGMGEGMQHDMWRMIVWFTTAVFVLIEYIPQIRLTNNLGRLGNLSLLSLVLQVLATLFLAGSLWWRLGWDVKNARNIWLLLPVVVLLQIAALIVGILNSGHHQTAGSNIGERERLLGGTGGRDEL